MSTLLNSWSLTDCLSYMRACTVTHNVVQYVFAHRDELDFHSLLDDMNTIALSSTELMTVLYAHTRATRILNFCLNPSFTCFDEFSRYFNLYWSYQEVCPYQDQSPEIVGHPVGQLDHISFLGRPTVDPPVNRATSSTASGVPTRTGLNPWP